MAPRMQNRVTLFSRVRQWYEGELVSYGNDPSSQVVLMGGWQRRHWTAATARAIVEFYLRHWQWIWTTIIAVSGLVAAVLALK